MAADLPVAAVLPELREVFSRHSAAVLAAPPGSGKTTLVPPGLLSIARKIIMLEPRRLAARAAACRIAELLGEEPGRTAGYRVRGEQCVSPGTRIEVVTEGILTRMLQDDPELDGVDLLIFDEFHERHLDGDLALALALDAAAALRPDLKILVMSATLEEEKTAKLLGNAPVIRCNGTLFPVREHWGSGFGTSADAGERAAAMAYKVLQNEPGDILIFLPGYKEIMAAAELLEKNVPSNVRIHVLYGSMELKQQRAAIQPAPPEIRKIVIATNIAESSLTIEGIRSVIDSGLERSARFDPASGMERLVTVRSSQSSMRQRAGRAGRLAPGAVYRFCTESEFFQSPESRPPEICTADLTGFVLELACWGAPPDALRWLDPPPGPAWQEGEKLLQKLGALDDAARLTPRGRAMSRYPAHPRLAGMMLAAKELDLQPLAAELAALVTERDIGGAGTDLRERLALWRKRPKACPALNAARDALLRAAGCRYREQDEEDAAQLLAHAYPDRIGRRRGRGFLLSGGRGAAFPEGDCLAHLEWIIAAHLDGAGANARIRLALPYSEELLRQTFEPQLTETVRLENDRVTAFREEMFGAVTLQSTRLAVPDAGKTAALLADVLRQRGENLLALGADESAWLTRLRFACRCEPEVWQDPAEHWEEILLLTGARSVDDLRKTDWKNIFCQWLTYPAVQKLDAAYPERFLTPAGSRLRIDYSGETPTLAVKVQEMYGQKVHPSLAGGKWPLLLHRMSPAGRPIQITGDLPGFWRGSWELVRKEMRGRYPKHVWPEDPANAAPTTRAKPRQ
ncbi:MAG: ATP-dependent helicase HrpB [Lentisphaeria bacterium]|nr:ATP-dependent helicase HrpB [Lentisphaeria bacterium]